MKDYVFIESVLQKGREAKDKVRLEFSGISFDQLNWKPSPESWSIAQCLDHLIVSDGSYFTDLKKITEGTYKMTVWERYNPFSALCGGILRDRMKEQVKKKMKAPKKIRPSASEMKIEIIDRYYKNLDTFLDYISNCRDIDIDKIIINSPTIPMVTYSLRDAFQFLVQHEHRHIKQATKVKTNENFPQK